MTICFGLVFGIVIYCIAKAACNFYFHPLANFPGPWWAAVSSFPEFYYDVIEGGRYFSVVADMHEKYGKYKLLPSNSSDTKLKTQVLWCASTPMSCT